MAWAVAIAFLALFCLWIVTGFIGQMLEYHRRRDARGRDSDRWGR